MHGSRSGRADYDVHEEFASTVRYVQSGANGYGWHATIGDDEIAIHMDAFQWGHNARAASPFYVAVELAQPLNTVEITDGQVRTLQWYLEQYVWPRVPWFPLIMPTHAEVERSGETGARDGKDDVFSYGDDRANDLRRRIESRYV